MLGELTCSTPANSVKATCSTVPLKTAHSTTYSYNGDGLRMSDEISGTTQQFTWDISGSIPVLLSDGTDFYLYGPNGTPIEDMTTSRSTDTFLASDPTGIRYQFHLAGTADGSNTYNPYGQCVSCTAKTAFGFEDGYTDLSGLIYLDHRYWKAPDVELA